VIAGPRSFAGGADEDQERCQSRFSAIGRFPQRSQQVGPRAGWGQGIL